MAHDVRMSTQDARGPGPTWRSRLTSRGAVIAIVTTLVIAVGAGAWAVAWHRASTGLRVETVSGPECEGASTRIRSLGFDPAIRVDTMRVEPGMRCVYTVRVVNDGPFTVHLDRAVLPFLGARGGGVVKALPPVVLRTAGTDDIDASVRLDRDLRPGASTDFSVPVGFRARGCNDGTTWVQDWPSVSFQVLGGHARSAGRGVFAWSYRQDQPDGCSR